MVRWMPWNSPSNAMVMCSRTVTDPLAFTLMESLKSVMRQLLAKRGRVNARRKTTAMRVRPDALGRSFRRVEGLAGCRTTTSELHRDRFAVGGFGYFEELASLESKHAGNNVRRERLNLGIQVSHHSIVVAARILKRVFRLTQRSLQLGEFFGSLQLGIILRHREQALQRAA